MHRKFKSSFVAGSGLALLIVLTAAFLVPYFGCNGPRMYYPPLPQGYSECSGNGSPYISAVKFVNPDSSELVDNITITSNQTLTVAVGYDDKPECNLIGGSIYYQLDGGTAELAGAIPDTAPCEATVDQKAISFTLPVVEAGSHTLTVYIEDVCNADSNRYQKPFDVTQAIGDDDSAGDDDIADDDTSGDDDTSVANPAHMAGTITYNGTATGDVVKIHLFKTWIPTEDSVFVGTVDVPVAGFPFFYDLELTGVDPENYYIFAFLDTNPDDGAFNISVDPYSIPITAVTIQAGQTATYNFTLNDPTAK